MSHFLVIIAIMVACCLWLSGQPVLGAGRSDQTTNPPNLIYNSSFEIATNLDVPDGWSRDFSLPPWSHDVYVIDSKNAWHGKNSLRLGHKGKSVRSWTKHTKIVSGTAYTLSVYLKASRTNIKASIDLSNVGSKKVVVGKDWQRFWLSGIAREALTNAAISLQSDGFLWVDAVQVEKGPVPTPYLPSSSDLKDYSKLRNDTYTDLYRFCRSQFPPEKKKVSQDNKAFFDFIGTEYDYYTIENLVGVRCYVRNTGSPMDTCTIVWHLEKGGNRISPPTRFPLRSGKNEWWMNIKDLAPGEYVIKATFLNGHGYAEHKQAVFRKLEPRANTVRINRWGRFLVVDGKPFFFFGFYDNLRDGDVGRWNAVLQEMKSAGTNGTISYVGGTREFEWLRIALDNAHKHNQKMWVHLGWIISSFLPKYANRTDRFTNEEAALQKLKKVVSEYRHHPALLGWATLDEPDNRPAIFTKSFIKRYYRLVKSLDPYHPCIISHLSLLGSARIYSDVTDIAVIPYSNHRYYDDLFAEYWQTGIPIFTNTTCIGGHSRWRREPTREELRNGMMKAVIKGARGLCSYKFRCNSMHTWGAFAETGKMLAKLQPALSSKEEPIPLENKEVNGSLVSAILIPNGEKWTLISVNNGSDGKATFQFNRTGQSLIQAQPLFQSPAATINRAEMTISLRLASQQVAAYDLYPIKAPYLYLIKSP